jgi:hypothetical protein
MWILHYQACTARYSPVGMWIVCIEGWTAAIWILHTQLEGHVAVRTVCSEIGTTTTHWDRGQIAVPPPNRWSCCYAGKCICNTRFLSDLSKLGTRNVGRVAQSVWRMATGWTVRESNPGGGEIFRTCPGRPWGPPSLLYNGYRVFPGSRKRPRRDADLSPPSSSEV